jgi:hypothetical protein
MVPVTDIPAKFRWYVQKDTFPTSREMSPDKAKVNAELLVLSARCAAPSFMAAGPFFFAFKLREDIKMLLKARLD